MKRLALYMFYDSSGVVADYVIHKLRKLKEHVAKIVAVCNGELTVEGRDRLEDVADLVHVRKNEGFDVWAYREGLIEIVGLDQLGDYDEIILCNYTFYAPIFPFAEMFGKMEARDVDFWGVTAFDGPTANGFTGVGTLPLHIQSHFIAVRRSMFEKKAFHDYWRSMPLIKSYVDSILTHESRFTEYFSKQGFKYAIYCDPKKYQVTHAAFDAVDTLIEDRCPILKRRPLFHEPLYLDQNNVEVARAIALLKAKTDFDVNLIWKDVTRIAKPRNLYTNAALLEVLDDKGKAPKLRSDMRVGVLAHIYYVEMLAEILTYLRHIPVEFDLYVTTANEKSKAALEAEIGALKNPGFKLCAVEVAENRGRDVSALVISLKDVVLNGSYDYLCRVHSKMTPQNSFGMARHFKEHLYENLLASPTYVANVLKLFEQEARLGIVMPPVVHIGYPTLGNAWFTNRPLAETWAQALEIKVPFDDFTPLAVYGTMWWFRPDALKRIFSHTFRWEDFPQEPNHCDGGLAHALERLFVYASHQDGFYTKCVLTPVNAAKNYVNLEYKLQNIVGRSQWTAGANELPNFPTWAVKHYLNCRLASVPRIRSALQKVYRASRTTYQAVSRVLPN